MLSGFLTPHSYVNPEDGVISGAVARLVGIKSVLSLASGPVILFQYSTSIISFVY